MDWKNIILEIKAHGLTQAAIAAEIGTSQGHISDIETGKRGKRLSFELAQKLIGLRDRLRKEKKSMEAA